MSLSIRRGKCGGDTYDEGAFSRRRLIWRTDQTRVLFFFIQSPGVSTGRVDSIVSTPSLQAIWQPELTRRKKKKTVLLVIV